MRKTPAGASPEKERWLLSELKSGMDDWDPGPASFGRVLEVGRRRSAARRRNSVVGVLAAVAAVLLVLAFAPPGGAVSAVAGNFVGSIVGNPSPGVRSGESPAPQTTPSRVEPIVASPGQQREPLTSPQAPLTGPGAATPTPAGAQPQQQPAPPESPSEAPVVAGPQTPASTPVPSPTPTPLCLLHLLCL
jgi:hypothetical protein